MLTHAYEFSSALSIMLVFRGTVVVDMSDSGRLVANKRMVLLEPVWFL
jgi:hypothetical protein